jgi:hypothetical protein
MAHFGWTLSSRDRGVKAIVVYESHWGSTAAVARAIAEGMGHEVPALDTDEAYRVALSGLDLIVAGSPVIAFGLPRLGVRRQLAGDVNAPRPADLSHPLLREWLDVLHAGGGWAAAFETRIWWSPRGATGTIESKLREAGYARLTKAERFMVGGAYGPLREGELSRARVWGATLTALLAERMDQDRQEVAAGGSQRRALQDALALVVPSAGDDEAPAATEVLSLPGRKR